MSHNRKLPEYELVRLLKRYEDGSATEDERQAIEIWLEHNPIFSEHDSLAKEHIQEEILVKIKQAIHPVRTTARKNILYRISSWGWAAAILLFLGSVWWYVEMPSSGDSQTQEIASSIQVQWKDIRTLPGQRLKVGFPDGSVVWLNANSVLRYNSAYSSGTQRDVYLDQGEAFFDVSSDTLRPFIVHTAVAQSRVVGTEFNIKLQDIAGNYILSMLSGEVELTTTNRNSRQTARVVKGRQAIIDPDEDEIHVSTLEDQEWNMWRNNMLSFKSATWPEVKRQLEEWYGVDVKFVTRRPTEEQFTARFKNESLINVLTALQAINQFSFEIKEQVVYIH